MKKMMLGIAVASVALTALFFYGLFRVTNDNPSWWVELTLPQAIVIAAVFYSLLGGSSK